MLSRRQKPRKLSKRQLKQINRKVNTSGLDSDASQTIIYSLVIVVILVIFGALVFLARRPEPSILGFENQNVWERAFKEVEGNRVGIVFDSVDTSEKEYNELRVACNTYLEALRYNRDDIQVGVDVVADEQQYIDGNVGNAANYNSDNTKVETGPLYFDDAIIIRYINESGKLQVICGLFEGDNKESISVYKQGELTADDIEFDIPMSDDIAYVKFGEAISESTYAVGVAQCIKDLLEADNVLQEREAINNSLSYFTSDGKDTILKCRNILGIEPDDTLEVKMIAVGKSDTNFTIKNRIYIKYQLGDKIFNIIVKMNSNLRIFDIDLI